MSTLYLLCLHYTFWFTNPILSRVGRFKNNYYNPHCCNCTLTLMLSAWQAYVHIYNIHFSAQIMASGIITYVKNLSQLEDHALQISHSTPILPAWAVLGTPYIYIDISSLTPCLKWSNLIKYLAFVNWICSRCMNANLVDD